MSFITTPGTSKAPDSQAQEYPFAEYQSNQLWALPSSPQILIWWTRSEFYMLEMSHIQLLFLLFGIPHWVSFQVSPPHSFLQLSLTSHPLSHHLSSGPPTWSLGWKSLFVSEVAFSRVKAHMPWERWAGILIWNCCFYKNEVWTVTQSLSDSKFPVLTLEWGDFLITYWKQYCLVIVTITKVSFLQPRCSPHLHCQRHWLRILTKGPSYL
jgi:hypothetical protein